jgi:hypothetical protein
MTRFRAHAMRIGTTWIGGILSTTAENQPNIQSDPTAGSPYPQFVSINSIKSQFTFRTFNVAAALGQIGSLGLTLGGGVTTELWEINYDSAGQIAAGAVHRRLSFGAGRIVPRRLTARAQEDAELEFQAMGLSANGTDSPLIITEGQALPAVLDLARHTLADATVANIAAGCVTELDIDFGIQIESRACTGQIFDTRLHSPSIVPKVTVTVLNAALVGAGASQIPDTGRACLHATTRFRFRRRVNKVAAFVADATAEHMVITTDGTVVPTTTFSGDGNEEATATLEITSMFDGTNAPIVINTASALA